MFLPHVPNQAPMLRLHSNQTDCIAEKMAGFRVRPIWVYTLAPPPVGHAA